MTDKERKLLFTLADEVKRLIEGINILRGAKPEHSGLCANIAIIDKLLGEIKSESNHQTPE